MSEDHGTPQISVLMPVYNGAKYIKEAIDSVLNQTFQNFEVVIINDGSTDRTEEVINTFQDPRIRLINNPENKGLIFSLNRGLENCRGEYIARMDQDDICLPDRFEKQFEFLKNNPKYCLVGSWAMIMDKNETIIEDRKTETLSLILKFLLLTHNPFTHSSIFFRKKDILEVGAYNTPYLGAEDYEMYTRLALKSDFCVLPEFLMKYRTHEESITQDKSTYNERLDVLDQIIKKYYNNFLPWANKTKIIIHNDKKIYKAFCDKFKSTVSPEEYQEFKKWYKTRYSSNQQKFKNLMKKIIKKVIGKPISPNLRKFITVFQKQHLKENNLSEIVLNSYCKESEVQKWKISDFVTSINEVVTNRPFPLDEQMLMASALCLVKPKYVFEWGTHIGKSARLFSEAADFFNVNCHIHSIDLPDDVEHGEHPKNERGKLVRDKKNVTLHQGDGVKTALKIINEDNNKGKYLFFVDGDHEYESVKRELNEIHLNVPKASILLHDTFYQSQESSYNIGPYKAIKEFLADKQDQYKVYNTELGLPGMTLLLKK